MKQETTCKRGNAFITTSKGFCYLTIRCGRHNFRIMRIRNYTIDADDKREMRRLHRDVVFDWKKIARQLAGKRETVPALPLPAVARGASFPRPGAVLRRV
jgi:hypothetical protein